MSIQWLSKGNMLAHVYEMKDEFVLFFAAHGKQDLFSSIKSKKFQLMLAYLSNIFKVVNDLNLILGSKNTNHINDYDSINAFMAK